MANKALKLIAGTALTGLVAMPNPLWAAITAAPAISSSTHTANQTSTASDITLSWTAATSDQTGDTVTYEFLFDTNTSHTLSSFQSAFEANGGSNDAVPFNGTLTNTSRSFNDVPDGTYYFHLQAYDTDGPLSGSNIQTFGPLKLNSAPTLVSSPISPASGNHSQTVSVTISGSRFIDGATASLFGPNDVTGVTAAKVSLTSVVVVDANTITATVPASIIPGTYDVRVTNPAPFNQQVSSSNKFTSSNTAPTADAGSDQVVDMTSGSVNLSLNGSGSSDADGDTLTSYTWTVLDRPTGSALSIGQEYSETIATKSVSVAVTGTYQFGLKVSDGYKSSTQDTVNFTVQSTTSNNPPTANAGANVAAIVGASVSLDGTGSSDTNGDALTYSWSFTSRPSGSAAAFDDATSSTPSFTADLAGTYNVSLTVDDGTASDSDSMVVTVTSISLDVDGDGDADANDGVMIQRRLTGAGTVTTNISLPTSVGGSGSGGARTNSEVVAAIDAAGTGFDVDGDTDADANDGVMIQRRLTGAGTVTTNISLPTGVGGTGTGGAMSNGEVVVVIDNITP